VLARKRGQPSNVLSRIALIKEHRVRASIRSLILIPAFGLLAGCLAGPPANAQAPTPEAQTYLKYAGPPIDSFTYLGHYYGFHPVGGPYAVIRTTVSDAYLLKVRDPCIQLPFATKVELTSTAHTVSRTFDWLIVGQDHCHIATIQRLDYDTMRRANIVGP
jgi:hypothetical protein